MSPLTVHPYDDTHVIDARAPRTNQAVVGPLGLAAFVLDAEWARLRPAKPVERHPA